MKPTESKNTICSGSSARPACAGWKDSMNSVELMQIAENKVSFRTPRQLKSIALHSTEAGEGRAFFVASLPGKEDAATAARASYALIADALCDKRMEIVHERIFGSLSAEAAVLRERNTALSERQIPADRPVTYVEGNPPWAEGLAGIIIHAVSSGSADDVWTIMDGENLCGRCPPRPSLMELRFTRLSP